MDLLAAIEKDFVLAPGERKLIPTGISLSLPRGYEAQIRPRSGLALKNGITLLTSPCTIDSDYRGEVSNFGKSSAESVILAAKMKDTAMALGMADSKSTS